MEVLGSLTHRQSQTTRLACFRWKMEKEGYETVFAVAPTFNGFFD